MASPLPTLAQINSMVQRPFRQQVDLETVALVLVLLLVVSGLAVQLLDDAQV